MVIIIFKFGGFLSMVSKVSQEVAAQPVYTPAEASGARRLAPAYYRRNEDLDADTIEISSKKKKVEDKGFFGKTIDKIGDAANKFVDITVNAFTKAAADAVVDKAVGKISGK